MTAPLWQQIEDNSHLLCFKDILRNLQYFVAEAKDDSNGVIIGELRPLDWEGEDDYYHRIVSG